jgi:hypothetical protein
MNYTKMAAAQSLRWEQMPTSAIGFRVSKIQQAAGLVWKRDVRLSNQNKLFLRNCTMATD